MEAPDSTHARIAEASGDAAREDLSLVSMDLAEPPPASAWSRIVTLAGLVVLGITPWASAQLPGPDLPAVCPPITFIQTPSLFDVFWGTTPIRFPYQ